MSRMTIPTNYGGAIPAAVSDLLLPIATSIDPALNAAVTTAIIDNSSGVIITLTAAGNAQTLQNPANLDLSKRFIVINNDTSGANTIDVNGITLSAGEAQRFIWDGTAWVAVTAVDADDIAFTPYGDLVATDVQAALQELDDEKAPITHLKYPPIPIEWALDGASPPDAVITLTSTFKIPVREFRGDVGNQDVYIPWSALKDLTGGTIKFRVRGYITNATAPADAETVIFTLAGSSRGNSELLSKGLGGAVSATFTADATYVQYDRWATAWSGDVTITDLLADEDVMLQLIRDQGTDTYEEKIGVAFIDIEYTRTVGN